MDIEGIKGGQTLIAAIKIVSQSKTAAPAQLEAPASSSVGDLIDVGSNIDSGYAEKVLNNALAERLDKAFAEAGVNIDTKQLLASSMDISPEATAKRIVDFSTGFLANFKINNKDLKGEEQVDKFTSLIEDAVKKGFEDAGKILGGLGPVDEGIQGNMDHTLELAMKGIDDFASQQKKSLAEQQKADQEKAASQPAGTGKKGDLVGVI